MAETLAQVVGARLDLRGGPVDDVGPYAVERAGDVRSLLVEL